MKQRSGPTLDGSFSLVLRISCVTGCPRLAMTFDSKNCSASTSMSFRTPPDAILIDHIESHEPHVLPTTGVLMPKKKEQHWTLTNILGQAYFGRLHGGSSDFVCDLITCFEVRASTLEHPRLPERSIPLPWYNKQEFSRI